MNRNSSMQLILSNQTKSSPKNIPAFLNKLYNMVNDPLTQQYIRWSNDGGSFLVFNQEDFAKAVLPKFFKHNNFTSFIRQLNMYGFHKIPHITQGALIPVAHDSLEFSNPNFQ